MCAESTGDEIDAANEVVQEPHSDTAIPETPLDQGGQFHNHGFAVNNQSIGRDKSLSPGDQALVERLGPTKKAQAPDSSLIVVKYLTKPTIESTHRPTSSFPNFFSFMPAKNIRKKTASESEDAASQLTTRANLSLSTVPGNGEQQCNSKINVLLRFIRLNTNRCYGTRHKQYHHSNASLEFRTISTR